ncbi:MAG: TlpA family protein disulfide reductase [Candidatus Handelsmanbacteria bacterium]|nr:TlpA family protein disulfide reductase [Candidatus Handelsmanbacteria bacterium]
MAAYLGGALVVALVWLVPVQAEVGHQFVLPDLEGREVSLREELAQGPVVLDFWATWCKPCIKSLPVIAALAAEYRDRGVRLYTVNVDGPRNQAKIRPFLQRHQLQVPVLLDRTNEVMKQFQPAGPPATLVLTAQGGVVYRLQGHRPGDDKKLRDALDALIPAKP